MNSVIKFQSNEGGIFDAQNNKVSFTIPSGDHYDLSTAYINLVMSVPITAENDAAQGPGVYVPNVHFQGDNANLENYKYENSALLRNAVLKCDQKGTIEQIQRADILTQNLNNYSFSQDEATSTLYERLIQEVPTTGFKSSIFNELQKEGVDNSRNLVRQPVRIKLSDVMNFAKTKQYSTKKYGKTDLELELNLDRLQVRQYLGAQDGGVNTADWTGTNAAGIGGGNQSLDTIRTMTATIGAALDVLQIGVQSGGGVNNNIISRRFNRLEDHPYWVGQKLSITATYTANSGVAGGGADPQARGGNGARTVIRRITEIRYNRGENNVGMPGALNDAGSISLVLNAAIDANGALTNDGRFHNISVRGDTCTFSAPQVDFAELVVEKLASPNAAADEGEIQYTTYTTEEFDTPAQVNFQRQFQAEPEAITMYITQPTDNTNNCILSRQNGVDSYRLRIDNKDCSNRDITLRDSGGNVRSNGNDPLHIEKQKVALTNSNRILRDLHERQKNINVSTGETPATFDTDTMLIGQVLPLTNRPKQVQVNINCRAGNGLQRLCLFKECVRSI